MLELSQARRPGAKEYISALKQRPEAYWHTRGERRMMRLFIDMCKRVPAYADFLRKHSVRPGSIRSADDFKHLPLTSKDNYLRSYELQDLCWDGVLTEKSRMFAATSGSTGEPYYFPRSRAQDEQFRFTLELLLRDFFMVGRRKTLFIDCFALGIWIGGMYMYQALKYMLDDGKLPLSVLTPGAYKEEALKAIKRLGKKYDQIIIGGYAPLVKDLIDDGERMGITWSNHYLRFFFAAEGFSEDFRDYVHAKCGIANPFISSFNHYGTADMGTMAHETPQSILLRRLSAERDDLRAALFNDSSRQPTLCQFMPELFYFEEVDTGLVCSSASGLPLMRYDLKDRGGIFTLADVVSESKKSGIVWDQHVEQLGLRDYAWNLPFVYVYERRDLTVSIYSVNVYPESIHRALERKDFAELITTKFTLKVGYDTAQNQRLELHVERKPGVEDSSALKEKIQKIVVDQLNEENSEWRDFYADEGIRHKILPEITTWPYQDPEHFKPGAKQKWVKK